MKDGRAFIRSGAVLGLAALLALPAGAQVDTRVDTRLDARGIAQRVSGVREGTVRLSYAAMPGVCGNGRGGITITRREGKSTYTSSDDGDRRSREWIDECEPGPVRVSLDVERGAVARLRAYVGGDWRGAADLDLGMVPAKAASDYLLGIASGGESKPATDAIFPASIAEGVTTWPTLLRIAKDVDRPRRVRESALFWVSQAAGDAATKGLEEIVDDPRGEREVREAAVFSLSQRPADESVPALIRVAKTNKDPKVRRSAIFWLGQSKDQRAIAYFESVLGNP